MAEQMASFPYWQVSFDEQGQSADAAEAALLAELPGQALTDLFIISHGWNNDLTMARRLYAAYLAQMQALLADAAVAKQRTPTIGAVGVIWPSMRWPDEQPPLPPSGGAASFAPPASTSATVLALKAVYPAPAQQQALDDLAALLQQRPADPAQFGRFQQLLQPLVSSRGAGGPVEDTGEQALLTTDPRRLFPMFGAVAQRPAGGGGAASLGDAFARLWGGALEVLRAATYFEMKQRAGVVGSAGVGPLIGRISQAQPGLRIHLLGHSFGARVVAFTLAGLPTDGASPVKSVFLLQGAFSHFAFAPKLPQDPARSGALAGKQARVDGPLLVSHSIHDTAVGQLYPLASLASQDDSAAFGDALFRWGAMGADGAQSVSAADAQLGPVGQGYAFTPGGFVNLNGDTIITAGGPPNGAHGDIFHPQLAWATLAAAGIC